MNNKLVEIFAAKRQEGAVSAAQIPLSEMRKLAEAASPPRGFKNALLSGPAPALIAEVKKASPSKGVIRENFDATAIARDYERAGAQCLSVLTDEQFFRGSRENLRLAREATALPCLRKDFIETPYDVYQSRAWDADAILLIASWLGPAQLQDLLSLARELGMDVLVEIHTAAELEIARQAGSDLVGVNSRDLGDFHESLGTVVELLPKVAEFAVPVAESSIASHDDVLLVSKAGARAVLVGTAFCKSPDIEAKVREVMVWR